MANKRHLYDVYIIDPKAEKVLEHQQVFGENEKEALIAADINAVAKKNNIKIKDLSIGVIELCEVKQPVREVKIVE